MRFGHGRGHNRVVTHTIVTRTRFVGGVLDRRNRPWVHDGSRWQRADKVTVEARRYQPDPAADYCPVPSTLDVRLDVDGELTVYKSAEVATRRALRVWTLSDQCPAT